jgi:hypothetical protein
MMLAPGAPLLAKVFACAVTDGHLRQQLCLVLVRLGRWSFRIVVRWLMDHHAIALDNQQGVHFRGGDEREKTGSLFV